MIALLALVFVAGSASVVPGETPRVPPPPGGGENACVEGTGDVFTLSVNRRWNESSGEWLRTFSARKVESGSRTERGLLELETSQGSMECDGKRITHVRVLVKEVPGNGSLDSNAQEDDRLIFHPRHGKNVVLMNNRRTAQKLDLDDNVNAAVFTHRPLKNNELFEVRLDKRIVKTNHCFGLGVMTHSPDVVEIKSAMYFHKNGTWMYYNSAIYSDSKELSKYGQDINKMQARDRLGVMRREDGSIHFFMNGVDLGRAVANVPEPVYGIVEISNDAVRGTIVY